MSQEDKPVAECCNQDCEWRGDMSECVMLGSVGPLCPECREVVEISNQKPVAAQEPVAVICRDWTICFIGSGPIAPIVQKHNLKIGSQLYANAAPCAELQAKITEQEPFCYMSDQFEVGLFTEPPTDPVFADMFPVYRNQIDAQAKITEQAAELSRINRIASCGSVDSWMSLSDDDKRKWFAVTLDVDQKKADRIKSLEAEAADRESFLKTLAETCAEAERIAIERAGRIDALESECRKLRDALSETEAFCKRKDITIERQRKVIEDVKQFINTPISVESCARMNAAIAELEKGVGDE